MNREMASHNETWDFYGHGGLGVRNNFYSQRDWNRTLITKINMISSKIHHATRRGGADTIEINPEILTILESMEFYNPSTNTILFGRMNIIINRETERNVIYVYNKQLLDQFGGTHAHLPFIDEPENIITNNKKSFIKKRKKNKKPLPKTLEEAMESASFLPTINMVLINSSDERFIDYKRKMVGYIEVQNYIS